MAYVGTQVVTKIRGSNVQPKLQDVRNFSNRVKGGAASSEMQDEEPLLGTH